MPSTVVRAKGLVRTVDDPQRTWLWQARDGRDWLERPPGGAPHEGRLVFILGPGPAQAEAREVLRRLTSALCGA